MVFSRSVKIWFQLMPLRSSRELMNTLRSSTVSFSGWWITPFSLACWSLSVCTCFLSMATSWRTSPNCLLSSFARWISTPRLATNKRQTSADATIMARSRRNGWLARLIAIFISVIPGHRAQITQQSRVVLPRHSQRRPQLVHFHRQFLFELPLRLVRPRAESAQQELVRAPAQVVLHIDERRHQYGGNIFQFVRRQIEAAHQLQGGLVAHQQRDRFAGELGYHRQSTLRRQLQRRQGRSGHQPGIQAGRAKWSFETRDDIARRHHHHHIEALRPRLCDIAHRRALHVEGDAAFQPEEIGRA